MFDPKNPRDRESRIVYNKTVRETNDTVKGYEQTKLVNKLQQEIKAAEAWKTIASILLLAFVFAVILHLIGVF